MKKIFSLILLYTAISYVTAKTANQNGQNSYYPILGTNAKFKYADSDSYVFHEDLNKTEMKKGQTYSVIEIRYSWGKKVETLYRLSNGDVMYYDDISGTENMIMPREPKLGFKWQNKDQSWEYEIIDMNANLETPSKKYSGLLVMRASQLSNRDGNKLTEYMNFYQKGTGKIASLGNGKLMTYRLE